MAIPLPQALDDCRREEGRLSQLLEEDIIKFQQVEQTLTRHRTICSDALLSDFQMATGAGFKAEDRLWDSHQKINSRFKMAFANLRAAPGQKAIELRKLGSEYLKFIKNSQTFYRNFIKRLNQTYGGIPSLERVAKRLHSDLRSKGARTASLPTVSHIELCCHRTLIRLGDLSRYRETELSGTEKNWAPAYGYYDLALSVFPGSGVPYNQRAVIALAEKTLFRAIYYVYRSLSAEVPHPQGDMNLRRALHKIQQAWNSQELVSEVQATAGAALPKGMVAWYLRLLEILYHGKATSEKDALENEVISQLQVDMTKNPAADAPHKLIVTSIAAQHAAQERFESKQSLSHQNSYVLFLELNLRIFSALLRVFVDELKSNMDCSDHGKGSLSPCANLLSPTIRRTLPGLRFYGLWLEKTCEIIDSPAGGLSEERKAYFWSLYAETLTVMTAGFPPQDLADLDHMLEEDEDTIGFRPLQSEKNQAVWYHSGQLKSRWHDVSDDGERNVTQEMLYRIREFMIRGLELAVTKRVPIEFEQSQCRFTYQNISPEAQNQAQNRPDSIAELDTDTLSKQERVDPLITDETQDEEAARMVDDIVGTSADVPNVARSRPEVGSLTDYPLTPAQLSTERGSYGTVSPFLAGTHTVNDVMAVVYKQPKSTSPEAQPVPIVNPPGSTSRSSSQLHSPAMPQPLLHAPSETSVGSAQNQSTWGQYYPEDPLLPGLGVIPAGTAHNAHHNLSTPPATRSSALPPPLSHSRVNSGDTTRGIWGGGIFTPSYQPTDTRRVSENMALGHFGNGSTGLATTGVSQIPSSFIRSGKTSPSIPPNSANAPWNHTLRDSNRDLFTGDFEGQDGTKETHPTKLSWSTVAGGRNTAAWQPT